MEFVGRRGSYNCTDICKLGVADCGTMAFLNVSSDLNEMVKAL